MENNQQTCAACKIQNKICSPECPLASYFPPHKLEDLKNVSDHFGVPNFLKQLDKVKPDEKKITAKTLIIEANCRKIYPIGGILEAVYRQRKLLEKQNKFLREQNEFLSEQIEFHRQELIKK
ncbi:hypothetical protein C5167_041876 [Papaver somniferum]|nr:hypothetical protein C5167_041876 [Papaver somniferum]